jgi:hypothetical protein
MSYSTRKILQIFTIVVSDVFRPRLPVCTRPTVSISHRFPDWIQAQLFDLDLLRIPHSDYQSRTTGGWTVESVMECRSSGFVGPGPFAVEDWGVAFKTGLR